jgi:uracil-DNA glycosylase
MLVEHIPSAWKNYLKDELEKPSFKELEAYVENEYETETVYPAIEEVFAAFKISRPEQIKVVILGQDPYHGENQAHGLSFSVPKNQAKLPPSLKNIRKEIQQTLGVKLPNHGNLEGWAKQGVFLLNAVLTVKASEAASHQKKGWEVFTDGVIKALSSKNEGIVFILWGSYAQRKEVLIDHKRHYILKSVHPSPLSAHRGFFGQDHFNKANKYLESQGSTPIDWASI